jgi:single-strand DNA-binding protein
MRNLKNMVRLIGNVGMDPELKTLTNGNTVARFSLATSEGYINKEGEKVIDTQWHRIVELEFLNDIGIRNNFR